MNCTRCATPIPPGGAFCPTCGTVATTAVSASPAPLAYASAAATVAAPPAGGRGKMAAALVGGLFMVVILAIVALFVFGGGFPGGNGGGGNIEVEGERGSVEIARRVGRFEARDVQPFPTFIQAGAFASARITYIATDGTIVVVSVAGFDSSAAAEAGGQRVAAAELDPNGWERVSRDGGGIYFRRGGSEILTIHTPDRTGRSRLMFIDSVTNVPNEFFLALPEGAR